MLATTPVKDILIRNISFKIFYNRSSDFNMSKKKNIAGVARTAYLVCVLSLCFV
jgi:hypothetical protein